MFNLHAALLGWWSLIKPGGYLVLVIPDEDLYEQGYWPSRFNNDHKATFTMKKGGSWSPVSHNIIDLVKSLPEVEIVSAEVQDSHYDHALQTKYPPPDIKRPPLWFRVIRKTIMKTALLLSKKSRENLTRLMEDILFRLNGTPIDQTKREALAQIQVVARKCG